MTVKGAAIVDWLRFTFLPMCEDRQQISYVLNCLRLSSSLPLNMVQREKGIHFYETSYDINCFLDGQIVKVGTMATGGTTNAGTMMVELTGTGCSLIQDWQVISDLMVELTARITRCDVAVDFLDGEVTIDQIREMYFAGEFNAGGRTPSYFEYSGGSLESEGFKGRTFEIGMRKNGKLVRAYEKGRQLGNMFSLWVRIEVEIGSRDRVIPYDIILKPTFYFIGAHKALGSFVDGASERIKTIRSRSDIDLNRSVSWIRNSAGKHIDQLLKHKFKDSAELIEAVRVIGLPKKLENSALAKHMEGTHDPVPNQQEY